VTRLNEIPFVKGHGTGNDFVLIPDLDGRRGLSADQVRWLCDRRRGIGGDGVLRVVRTEHMPEFAEWSGIAEFFMDYRNSDGTVAEMCGNGARVFVRYLRATGLITDDEIVIGTRGGLRTAILRGDGIITIDMGAAHTAEADVTVRANGHEWSAVPVFAPNPHAVTFIETLSEAGDLSQPPEVRSGDLFPSGTNVEFVVPEGERHVSMRVHERGVGETHSCGTGACAVAWAARRRDGVEGGDTTYRVDVPGGTLEVTETAAGALLLTGPADLVAKGNVLLPL
jgi:diaminopimelate epimerase